MHEEYFNEEDPVYKAVRKNLGYTFLYPYQILVISMILESCGYYGKERALEACPNNIVILPTGYGKSVCFTVPSYMLNGISLVIYPLKALINDQLTRFNKAGLTAVSYHGGMNSDEKYDALQKLKKGALQLLLTTPESFSNPEFMKILSTVQLKRIFIDEAHTVTEWGLTFRPAFLEMCEGIQNFSDCTVTALTATASSEIIKKIQELIFPHKAVHVIAGSPNKENIHYSVITTFCKDHSLAGLLKKADGPTLVFCASRTSAELTALMLRRRLNRDDILFYHAGLSESEKREIECRFGTGTAGILCSTCAFGLGIDISGIRTVIHRTLPPTPEAFLQESGRGGRDGKQAHSISLISPVDVIQIMESGTARMKALLGNFLEESCRREAILSLFGVRNQVCSGCNHCDGSHAETGHTQNQLYRWFRKVSRQIPDNIITGLLYRKTDDLRSYPFTALPDLCFTHRSEAKEVLKNLKELQRSRCYTLS